jgi:hypothetical protein
MLRFVEQSKKVIHKRSLARIGQPRSRVEIPSSR